MWRVIMIVFNTLLDVTLLLATVFFLEDSRTPVKDAGDGGGEMSRTRFVHRIVSLDDVKLVKKALNAVSLKPVSVVISTQDMDLAEMMKNEELINGMWGNYLGFALLPLTIDMQHDPLTYIRRIKSTMDRLSLGHKCSFFITKLTMLLFGVETAARMIRSVFKNTTLTFSNVMGPKEEVNLFGHHLSYIAPSVCGFPQSLVVHHQSYGEKLIISIGADEKLIPNPYQLCDDLVMSLQNIKETVIERGLSVPY